MIIGICQNFHLEPGLSNSHKNWHKILYVVCAQAKWCQINQSGKWVLDIAMIFLIGSLSISKSLLFYSQERVWISYDHNKDHIAIMLTLLNKFSNKFILPKSCLSAFFYLRCRIYFLVSFIKFLHFTVKPLSGGMSCSELHALRMLISWLGMLIIL